MLYGVHRGTLGKEKAELLVNEVYGPTIQGEGKTIGKEVSFLRLSGCNLSCICFCGVAIICLFGDIDAIQPLLPIFYIALFNLACSIWVGFQDRI